MVRRYTGGHKGSIACLMTFVAASGEVAHNTNSSFKTWLIYWYLLLCDMNFDKLDFVIVDAEFLFCCLF